MPLVCARRRLNVSAQVGRCRTRCRVRKRAPAAALEAPLCELSRDVRKLRHGHIATRKTGRAGRRAKNYPSTRRVTDIDRVGSVGCSRGARMPRAVFNDRGALSANWGANLYDSAGGFGAGEHQRRADIAQ